MSNDSTVRIDADDLQRVTDLLSSITNGYETAMMRSINKAIKKARTVTSKGVRDKVALKVKIVNRSISTSLASRNNLAGEIEITQKAVTLKEYGARPTKRRGVSVTTWKTEGRIRYRHAFAIDRRGGNIYARNIQSSSYDGRYPLKALRGPSVKSVVDKFPLILSKAKQIGGSQMRDEMFRQVDVIINRAAGRG